MWWCSWKLKIDKRKYCITQNMITIWNPLLQYTGEAKKFAWFQNQLAIYMGKSNVHVIIFSTSQNVKGKFNLILLGFSNLTQRTVLKADYFINPYWDYFVPFLKHPSLAIVWNLILDRLLAYSRIALPVLLCLNSHVCIKFVSQVSLETEL